MIPPASEGGPEWNRLDPGDYRSRKTRWIRQIILHTTGGHWPQPVLAGAGPAGHAEMILKMWKGDRAHSASQIIVDFDGKVYRSCDLQNTAAYHAEMSNDWSIGIEMCTTADGGIYEATLHATAELVPQLCRTYGIPEQRHRGPYRNSPLARMESGYGAGRHQLGGPDCVGVFGHRDQTGNRGAGDPGDAIWELMDLEALDFEHGEDLAVGRTRQARLNAIDAKAGNTLRPLVVDGICGPSSIATMRRLGFTRWRDVA